MIPRQAVATLTPPPADLVLKGTPNWTGVVFFAGLSGLHWAISVPAFYHGRLEGYLSFLFALLFLAVAAGCYWVRSDLAILARERRVSLRLGVGRMALQRRVDFAEVHAIRLTLVRPDAAARIHLLCDNEDIECPPTRIPRQQALFLAMLIGVELIKATSDDPDGSPADSSRREF